MRIALMVDRMVLGGLETHIVTFTNELLLRGHHILLCTEYALPEIISQIHNFDNTFQHINGLNQCEKSVKRFNPDIIHAHPFAAIIKGVHLSQSLRKPLIITVHGFYDAGLRQIAYGIKVSDRASGIIAVDDGVATYLRDILPQPEKISVIYNGINLNTFVPHALDPSERIKVGLNHRWFTIAALSRLDDDKTPPIFQLIRCAEPIASRLGGIDIIIVGDGNMSAHLKNEAEAVVSFNNNVKIILVGRQDDVRPFLAMADLVVACDRSAMEAMACGRPVYAANGTGFADLITNKNYRETLSYRRGYSPLADEELTTKLASIALSHGTLEYAIRDGYDIIRENFDIRDKVNELEHIYKQTLFPISSDITNPESYQPIRGKRIRVNSIKNTIHKQTSSLRLEDPHS